MITTLVSRFTNDIHEVMAYLESHELTSNLEAMKCLFYESIESWKKELDSYFVKLKACGIFVVIKVYRAVCCRTRETILFERFSG